MALGKKHSVSTFITKILWILFLVSHESNLVICDGLEDDSLEKALEAIERRQRDLEFRENGYYGQPENIGYGFQKTLGFFDNTGMAADLGSFDSNPKSDNDLQNLLSFDYEKGDSDYENDFEKRKSNFRERMSRNYLIDQRDRKEEIPKGGLDYLRFLKNLWSKYRQSRLDDINVEDLTDEQVEEILNALNVDEQFDDDNTEPYVYQLSKTIPVRSRKNYRVFDRFGDRKKRYPSFGEGIYGKRNLRAQNMNFQTPSTNDFLYSLKYVNPESNRETLENMLEESFKIFGDEKDKDVLRILNNAMNRPKYSEEDEPYWPKDQSSSEEEDDWLPGPVTFSSDGYGEFERNEKRELSPIHFKNHNRGIHLNAKRFPVKRSTIRVRKEAKNDKVPKELAEIFSTPAGTTVPTVPSKKLTTKKPTTIVKQNATKPEMTKHYQTKKVVRRAEKFTKEKVLPMNANQEIEEIFNPKKKKSIDWSQYFGLDKRAGESWLKEDQVRKTEGHLMGPKSKLYSLEDVSRPQNERSFDTGKFSRKGGYSYDWSTNIDKMENKIGDIEEKIIDDAVKYTGAQSGSGKKDLTQIKNKVIQRLEAAYSLEKMRNALEEFKNLIKPGKNGEVLKKASTEAPKAETRTTAPKEGFSLEKPLPDKNPSPETTKRVTTKKEGVKNDFSPETLDSLEFLNDIYGNRQYESEDCPVLDKILQNCLRIQEMGGKYAELLVPLCSLQQICYFCGPEIGFSKMSMCDALYLTEAQNICQGDSDCQVNARSSMLALQDLYEQEVMSENGRRLFSNSCLANPCIQRYFLTAPGAIYPLEVQK